MNVIYRFGVLNVYIYFLGLAVARDIKGKRNRVVAVIDNVTITAGQAYEAMSNAGYLDSNMIVILNDNRHSLHPNMEDGSKASINALSSIMSKIQSSKIFRKFRELAKVFIFDTLVTVLRLEIWCLSINVILFFVYTVYFDRL